MFRFGNTDKQTKKSVLKMLKKILKLTSLLDPKNETNYRVEGDRYRFSTESNGRDALFPHLTLFYEKLPSSQHKQYWSGSVEEYNEVFNSPFNRFIQDDLHKVYELLREDGNRMQYTYPLNKYELTVLTALNTLSEGKEANDGTIPPAIQERVQLLLSSFAIAIFKVEQNRIEHEERMRNATNDSLVERLNAEIEFVHKTLDAQDSL